MTALAAPIHFTAGEVAAATGIPPEKQLQWHERCIIVPSRNDVRPNGSGDKRLMSRKTVYQIAFTAEGTKLGLSAKLAAYAARKFTDSPSPGRAAGKLFPQDRTVLVLRTTGPVVINPPCHADFCDLADHGAAFAALDCGIAQEGEPSLARRLA